MIENLVKKSVISSNRLKYLIYLSLFSFLVGFGCKENLLVPTIPKGIENRLESTIEKRGKRDHDDVAVIINNNSNISKQIGRYFASHRNIPNQNIIYINALADEEINDLEFNNLRSQVENYIQANNLEDKINYIVTTKGMPLKVNRGDTFSESSPSASVESELTLILGPYSNNIGQNGIVFSPYYYQKAHFSRSKYGIYLVTRLDGYTSDEIMAMIDKAAQPIVVDGAKFVQLIKPNVVKRTKFVFDQDPAWDSSLPGLNHAMASASTILTSKGYNVLLNTDSVYVTNQTDVLGYVSWGSNDHYANRYTQNAIPHNKWHRGALAETYVSSSGRTFSKPVTYGQSLVADLITEGITGVKGYVYEPYSFAMAVVPVLFDRYTSDYNLAESFYMASRLLSWMDVVIGDPKTSITK